VVNRFRVEKVENGKLYDLLKFLALAGFVGWLIIGIPSAIKLVRYFNCSHWDLAQGQVVASKVSPWMTTSSRHCYRPVIKYSFEFGGERRESSTWGFAFFDCSSPKWASDISNRWPKGRTVTVYVDRSSGRSVLDPDLSALWLIQAIGVSCLALHWLLHRKGRSRKIG
jgi:hypothetical protein